MNIEIIAVGSVKEKFYRDAAAEYIKRMSAYGKVSVREVSDEKTPEHMSETERLQVLSREAERLRRVLKDGQEAYTVALCIEGREYDSEGFAGLIESVGLRGFGRMRFIIGGSIGLDRSISEEAHERLSFSKMTFPHQLMRLILMEQLYRAFKIINHEPYHK